MSLNTKAEAPKKSSRHSAFKQQRLKAWQPILTPRWVIGSFLVIGVVFIIIGVIVLLIGNSVYEDTVAYEKPCNKAPECTVEMTLTKDVTPPIYVYYQLDNFYQNHRRYVQSRSDQQLRGDKNPDVSTCEPREDSRAVGFQGQTLYPCGLIANSHFNDVIRLSIDGTEATGDQWKQDGIIWKSDRDKFKFSQALLDASTDQSLRQFPNGTDATITLLRPDDPDLIVWMRTAGLPKFRKLYRIIDDGVKKLKDTKFTFSITNNFEVLSFGGRKSIVISTTSALGGKNTFLAWVYIVVGSICVLLAIAFAVKHTLAPRKLGDLSYWQEAAVAADGNE